MTPRIIKIAIAGWVALLFVMPFVGSRVTAQTGAPAARTLRGGVENDIVTHFKYGSVGTEGTVGLPYPIWRVLPVLFADKLPKRPGEGWERLGFIF